MTPIKLGNDACVCPMPMVIIGSVADGRNNFMAAAWVTRVNYKPAVMGVAIGTSHKTAKGIREHKQFSINIPTVDMVKAVDYVGMVSGNDEDKSGVFETFKGDLEFAPMVCGCSLTMECHVTKSVDFGADEFFIGDIVGVYSEECFLTNGQPDPRKMKPFALTMPDNGYWTLGERIGSAWDIGKDFRP